MNNTVANLKKLHSAMSIERKDLNLKEYVEQNQDPKTKVAIMEVVGFASKFVPKYQSKDNPGFHTMVYLKDGRKTGAFSTALYDFARFFYQGAGLDSEGQFNKIMFEGEGVLKVNVCIVPLDGGKSTYNFEIVDGEIGSIEKMGQLAGETPLLLQ